jgi:hypothetical protein
VIRNYVIVVQVEVEAGDEDALLAALADLEADIAAQACEPPKHSEHDWRLLHIATHHARPLKHHHHPSEGSES